MKIKYIGSVNKVMLPGIPGTFTRGMVYEVDDNIGWQILDNPLFICVDYEYKWEKDVLSVDEKVDKPEESPWQPKVQEEETPIEETPEIEVSEEPVKKTRRKRTPKEPPKEIEVPEETLIEPPEETKKEKEVNTNGS